MHYCAECIYRLVVVDTKCKVFCLLEEVAAIKGTVVLSNLCMLSFLIHFTVALEPVSTYFKDVSIWDLDLRSDFSNFKVQITGFYTLQTVLLTKNDHLKSAARIKNGFQDTII